MSINKEDESKANDEDLIINFQNKILTKKLIVKGRIITRRLCPI